MSSATDAETPAPARDRILDAAGPLFYRDGFRAVGVDRVIAASGVAKATFYKHFPSKDDLILAWIARAEAFSVRAAPPEDAPAPLSAYVEAMIAVAAREACLGCTFQVTAAEFGPEHPAHAAAAAAKRRVLRDLARRAEAQGLSGPGARAEELFLLLEGVWAAVRMFGREAPLEAARRAAARLIGAAA